MKIKFTKVVGTGNDFILIDTLGKKKVSLTRSLRKKLCSRRTGIGADGILLMEKDIKYPFRMQYYNADGYEAEMCGNGARCIALYAFINGHTPRPFSFTSRSGIHSVKIEKGNYVSISLPPFEFIKTVSLSLEGKKNTGYFVRVGVPHLIFFLKKVVSLDVEHIGRRIRYHSMFSPKGTNVNFAEIDKQKNVFVRTYERGVENETLSCGTGVAATAAMTVQNGLLTPPIQVNTVSGETITVSFKDDTGKTVPLLRGKAEIVYSGFITV